MARLQCPLDDGQDPVYPFPDYRLRGGCIANPTPDQLAEYLRWDDVDDETYDDILVIIDANYTIQHGLVPVTKVWPVVVALLGAGILAFVQRKYDCNLQSWWAWVITLGTVALTALAIRSNPVKPPAQS